MKFLLRLLINLSLFLLFWRIKDFLLGDFPMGLDQSPLRKTVWIIIGILLLWLGKYLLEKIYQHSRKFRQHPWQSCKQLAKEVRDWIVQRFNEKAIIEALERSKFLAYLSRPWLKYLFIPSLLLLFALGWSAYVGISSDSALSLLSKKGDASYFKNLSLGQEIKVNEPVNGQFQALENNLGMISIAFANPSSLNQEKIIFRIREKDTESWLTENEYASGQFHRSGKMYFGLPIQGDSKDKTYEFELELKSEMFTENDNEETEMAEAGEMEVIDETEITEPFSLSKEEPVIRTHYKFGKDYFKENPGYLINFTKIKLKETLLSNEFYLNMILNISIIALYLYFIKNVKTIFSELKEKGSLIPFLITIYLIFTIYEMVIFVFKNYYFF